MNRMHTLGALLCLLALAPPAPAIESPPTVNVYTEQPLEDGKENRLICLLSSYHPPDIQADLLMNGVVIPGVEANDMSFGENWKYTWMKHVKIQYKDGDTYSCRYTHMNKDPKVVLWEPMM